MAEVSLPFFVRLPMVGMAMSIRMRMMAMTMSNSISVKPSGCRCVRLSWGRLWEPMRSVESEDLRFMGFLCLVEQAGGSRPIRENATTYRREREMGRSKEQGSGLRGRRQMRGAIEAGLGCWWVGGIGQQGSRN